MNNEEKRDGMQKMFENGDIQKAVDTVVSSILMEMEQAGRATKEILNLILVESDTNNTQKGMELYEKFLGHEVDIMTTLGLVSSINDTLGELFGRR